MVKMPSLDDLKKVGANLVDTAKAANLGEVVNKLKTGVEAVTAKKEDVVAAADADPLKAQLQTLHASLQELTQLQAAQAALSKNIESQLSALTKIIDSKTKT
jgi:hypothetical protein